MDFYEFDEGIDPPDADMPGRHHDRPGRAAAGPMEVAFSVFVQTAPQGNEVVYVSANVPELQSGVQMQRSGTGNGRLWTVALPINPAGLSMGAAGPAAGLGGGLFGLLGALGSADRQAGRPPQPSLEVTYSVRNQEGRVVRQEDSPTGEFGPLRQQYYHRAKFPGADKDHDVGFVLLVHDEVFQLQSGATSNRVFHARMVQLAQASGFSKKRQLLDKALEELILVHWGENAVPPQNLVLAVAGALGQFRKQNHSSMPHLFDDPAELAMVYGMGEQHRLDRGERGDRHGDKEKEEDKKPSLVVCRWIVKHCPSRNDIVEDEDRDRDRGREGPGRGGGGAQMARNATLSGVRQAAETLYTGEKTFEWLKLLNFLPEHSFPAPVNASQCTSEESQKLTRSFINAVGEVFDSFRAQQANLARNPSEDLKERQKMEQDLSNNMDLFMRGLCLFCPSVACLQTLIAHVVKDQGNHLESVTSLVFQRLRSLHFGKEDKETLKAMISTTPFMRSDDCAVALLNNQHHPSEGFTPQEIIQFVRAITESNDGVRSAGGQLQSAARRWLMRFYGRAPERVLLKEDSKARPADSQIAEYQAQKAEIRESMRNAIKGWHMVLAIPCFKAEEETLRNLLFELSQAYFFKDQDPLLVLDCILELEGDIRQNASVWQLEGEIQRIAIKCVRDAQEMSELDHSEDLLALLFETPTRLRYVIIEAFIGFRQAAAGLGKLLQNEPIWSRLLSKTWISAHGIEECALGSTQKHIVTMLKTSAQQLTQGTIGLSSLHTIIQYQSVYESLVALVRGSKPTEIPASAAKLNQFDTEFAHLRVYVKMFCVVAHIEATDLDNLIEGIKEKYNQLELHVAAAKFDGLPVRPHLAWLHSLRGSDVFAGIWKEAARPNGESPAERTIKQDFVVSEIIPKAQQTWERLAKSIETGNAVLKDIRWCVDLEWAKVHHELGLLEGTAPKESAWVPRAADLCKSMRLASKLREWAPSMLHLREVLDELFSPGAADECVLELRKVVKEYEHMWEMELGTMTEAVAPYSATINSLSETMQDYTITAARHDSSLKWLLQHKSTEDFNRLLTLCRPNTDDPVILACIASLQQTRTFLAEALYTKPIYSGLRQFIEELASLHVDESMHSSLVSVQQSYDPMLNLLTTHSRTPGVQACYDLKKISETGHFHVVCSLNESAWLTCKLPDSEFNYEALAELRRQLLMTDVPYELDGAQNLPAMLEVLVEKFQFLEEYGRCTMELFQLGHFAYKLNDEVLTIGPKDTVEFVDDRLQLLQQKLSDWQKAVDSARGKHYFLNYFTVRELCYVAEQVPKADENVVWERLWPLLRVADLQADSAQTQKKLQSMLQSEGAILKKEGAGEVERLNAIGEVLGALFRDSEPVVRPLEGLRQQRQQLQGDLLIRSMQNKEQGVPVFVCCADEPSKVTELVLSIYTRRSRVPEAEELLLCSSHTTLEEIELLLRRFFLARKHKREERLYCVGNVHLLPYVTQCGTVEALRKLEEQFGFADASALVFASGLQNQMLTNALNRHNLAVSVLANDLLMEAVAMIGEKYHGRQLEAVASQMNGVGKTHYILRQIADIQEGHGSKAVMHHVEIRETTDISALVTSLLGDPTEPALPTAIHVDLAHILPSHVDTLIFELLIVGMLRDPQKCAVYHRRSKDFFFVEIPNTPGEQIAKQLSFCLILPRTFLRMGPERIDAEMPNITIVNAAPFVKFEKNTRLELVGKTLAAMKVEAFNPKSKDFNVAWTGKLAPAIPVEESYKLLEEVCSSETSPPSFLVFMNFVKFLGELVTSAEQWNMMNLALLQNFDPGLKHFKHSFFRLLIETSRDFALRQVPKAMDQAEISPLAPIVAANLMRGLTRGMSGMDPMPPSLMRGISDTLGPPTLGRQRSNGQPALQRQRSRVHEEQQARLAEDAQAENTGVGRISTAAYVSRFDQMPSWESCVHPVASFKKNERGTIVGCNIMSLQRDFIGNFIDRNLQNSLNLNDLKLERDWSKVTHAEAVHLVHLIEGGDLLTKKDHLNGPKEYVVTVDNLIKLMSIQQRLKYGLPVILMGETGCGKTALVKFLAQTLDFRLFTLDIHGGITDQAIINFLDEAVSKADTDRGVLVFFDEINAANCMALFKTIIIDRMYGNNQIPANVRIISCCNPYRLRKNADMEEVALVFQHAAGNQAASGISDPMKRLVYRVHPLPESLIDIVSDFGGLTEKSEEIYINAILRKELPRLDDQPDAAAAAAGTDLSDYDVFVGALVELLCQSQCFVREVNSGERSVVSMRDIARAARVFKWFLTYYSKLRGVASPAVRDDKDGAMKINASVEMRPHLRSAVILTLGYCYHSRLNRDQRWGYRKRLCETWQKMSVATPAVAWLKLDSANDLSQMLTETQLEFVSQMELGEGIALNEALRENLFMLLVSIMNQIPVLLIGKPGCSKSLAMGVLQNNLNGEVSNKEFFKSMPAVEVFAYQCSPLSTPDAILGAFHTARQSNLGHKSTIVCVLLDEVGLAEESPHLPLKVLHKELEDLRGISCVGISNWALDAAKMSRCVTLYRPPPTVEDLCVTAEGMVASANLKGYLRALSDAFYEIYKTQRRPDFWGMREFYSTVRVINAELKVRASKGLEAVLEPQVLMKTVQRNFGGQPASETEQCIEEFFERTGMSYQQVQQFTTAELIQQNLEEPDARHLMLLTKNNAALRLLFESNLLDHGKAQVMFGSTFPNDQSDIFVAMNLQRIKTFMQQPISLVMVHCDSLYESLYDLLNQHYMEYAGQRYVRIAHGSKAKQCPIHRLFRVIVITEISDAYFRLAPPLLNRFEKQIFLRKDLMTRADEGLLSKLTKFWDLLVDGTSSAKEEEPGAAEAPAEEPSPQQSSKGRRHRPIAGYHPELLSSLVFSLRRRESDKTFEEVFEEAKRLLTWVLTPEAVCIAAARLGPHERQMKFGFDIVAEYFEAQRHSDLPSFAEMLVGNKDFWCDSIGAQTMVMTYSPIRGKVGAELSKVVGNTEPVEVSLHELSSSTDIEKTVQQFYASAPPAAATAGDQQRRFMIIHADPYAASLRMIEHCRFVCEKARDEFVRKGKGAAGSMFVVLVVHLQRGFDGQFSFDFDSQWQMVFLDSVEHSTEATAMPALGAMLNMPLIDVVRGLEFPKLLKTCFRSSLSRMIYPHARRPEDLQKQIYHLLRYMDDANFVAMVRDWVLRVLETTPKAGGDGQGGSVGEDRHWFAAIASAAHELALAGTFRNALHNRVVGLVGSLATAMLAHLDRNGGLALLAQPDKRELFLKLSTASLNSPLSVRLQNEAIAALTEAATAQHEVGTDAQTGARPFLSNFPVSWFVSRSIDGVRHIIESLPPAEQLAALSSQYQLSKLHEVGLNPELEPAQLDDYLSDFTAMHLDWTVRIGRDVQQRVLKKTLQRLQGGKLNSVLGVHQLFWNCEKQVAYCVNLLNAVPGAVPGAEKLIDEADLNTLNLDLLLLVHQTLTEELHSGPPVDEADPASFYRDWLTRKMVVAGLTKDLILSNSGEGKVDSEKMIKLKTNTEPRVETLALLLQHVAYPLQLSPVLVRKFAEELPKDKIRHTGTLLAMMNLAQRIVSEPSQVLENGGRKVGLQNCSALIESWILDVCLRDAEAMNDLEPASLRLVCSLSAGLPVVIMPNTMQGVGAGEFEGWSEQQDNPPIAQLPNGGGEIPRSSCLNLALLRKLIVMSQGKARDTAIQNVEGLLQQISVHEQHNDSTFATRYAVLCEEHAALIFKDTKGPADWPSLSLAEVFKAGRMPAEMLKDVGKIRWVLTQYAKVLCAEPIDETLHDNAVLKVNSLLQTSDTNLMSVCRSMRLYLLKCVQRFRGLSFLRGLLAEAPLSDTDWVAKWRDLHDIDFEKFIGAALVPKWNPFSGADGSDQYKVAKVAVFEMMTSTSTEKLQKFAQDCARLPTGLPQKKAIGGLLMALCGEPGLLAALDEEDRRPPWRAPLNKWLLETTDLPVTDKERMLLRIFAGDDASIKTLPKEEQEYLQTFVVFGGRKMDDLLRWRFLGHLAACMIAAPETSVLSTLKQIALESSALMDGFPCFMPSMDEDIRNRVMKALLEKGENIWKFKSHWYKCSCGYTFFIGECGRPMEVAKCPGCGLAIGGRDHNKTGATFEDDESDRSPFGYMLPSADKDEKHISFREIPATSARAIRLLLHGSMFCGLVSSIGSGESNRLPRVYSHIVNAESMCTMKQDHEAKYIGDHFANDWQQMVDMLSSNVEDLAAGMHMLLSNMANEEEDKPLGSGAVAAAGSGNAVSWGVLTLQSRNSWEETVEAKYLTSMVKNFDTCLQTLYKNWGDGSEDGKFVAELKEAADVRDFPKAKREAEKPQLWAYRYEVTLDALHSRVGVEKGALEMLPVLCTVLQQPLFQVMQALGTLVGVFEWHALVTNHFSGRITRTEAGTKTVREVMNGLLPTERGRWERAYKQFERAWHLAWPYVERHECLELPENLRKMMIDRDSSMIWFIADSTNEGICPLALTQWLVERHNELVQVVGQAIGYPARKVSSRLLSRNDCIYYDEGELMRFLRSRCVTYGVGGKLNFDFKQMEQQLRRELTRPEITIELRGFQWLGESFSAGNELKTVINQRDIMPDITDRLKAELASPALANLCLQKVQMSISFILKSGGSLSAEHAGELLLSDYLRSVLSESPDCLPSACARSEIHLWHVDAFVKLLRQLINKDPMDSIDPKYKVDLPKELEEMLLAVRSELPDGIADVLGGFAETRLTETWIGDEYPILDTLDAIREDLSIDNEGFEKIQRNLPKELMMKHWAAVYRALRS